MAKLRVLSINLLVDSADPDDLRRVIVDADPDVVCAQELGPSTAAAISDILPHGCLDPKDDFFGLGIATRHPVTTERLDMERRPGWVARLIPENWPNLSRPLDVFDVHLSNPIDRPWRDTRAARRRQIAQIADAALQRDAGSVVIGDMNATPVWHEYKLLTELGVDAARSTRSQKRTWSQLLCGPRLLRIDHAFVAGAQPVATSTVRVRGTDHSALIVDIDC